MPSSTSALGRAYCSTANLGPGFDSFGLALERYNDEVKVEFTNHRRRVIVRAKGPQASRIPESVRLNSAGPPALEMLRLANSSRGLKITIHKNVPVGLGLGSSGATASACAKALGRLLNLDLSDEELIRIASLGEAAVTGSVHADNVAASLLGGFVIVYGRKPVQAISFRPPSGLGVVIATPDVVLPIRKTRLARSMIPRMVNVEKAVRNIGRASVMSFGLATGRIDVAGAVMHDEIAEPYRERLIPGYSDVKKAAVASGAAGAAISGAGPSIVALVEARKHDPRRVGKSMVREFAHHNVRAKFFVSRPAPAATATEKG